MQLKIGSWNIQGGTRRKLECSELAQLIERFDIFCIQETWLTSDINVSIPGYHSFRSDRKKANRAKRGSGGAVTFFTAERPNKTTQSQPRLHLGQIR